MKDYKEILEGVVNIINTTEKSDIGFVNICTYISENCPELKESEDEKIRKRLIEFFKDWGKTRSHCWSIYIPDILAWLDKQGEQKPAWSEEDEDIINHLLAICSGAKRYRQFAGCSQDDVSKYQTWLKSVKSRVQPKAELTQLDKNILEAAIAFVEQNNHFNCWGGVDKQTVLSALRSLSPQNRWKPSDAQLDALHDAAVYVDKSMFPYPKGILMKLYKQLKKLREE